jgi:hypothetical protein
MSKDKRFDKREYLFDGDEDYNDASARNKKRSTYKSSQDNAKADYSYQRRIRQQSKELQLDR